MSWWFVQLNARPSLEFPWPPSLGEPYPHFTGADTAGDRVLLAAALDLGDDLESLITYDERLASAAEANGITVTSPI